MSEATKVQNYTDEMVSRMVAEYEAESTVETVERLATELGKTKRSVIAKLSNLGVYKAQEKVTKSGKAVVRKDELVAVIEAAFDIKVESLTKANKADLEALVEAVQVMSIVNAAFTANVVEIDEDASERMVDMS